jgi:hypothetical protein
MKEIEISTEDPSLIHVAKLIKDPEKMYRRKLIALLVADFADFYFFCKNKQIIF